MEKFKAFLKRKNIIISAKRYGIDADRRFTSDVSIEIDPISPNPYILRHKDGSATPAFNIEQLLLNLQNATLNHQVQR